jgi:hypothetical protein
MMGHQVLLVKWENIRVDVLHTVKPLLPVVASLISLAGFAWAIFVYNRDNRRSLVVRQIGSAVENVILSMNDGLTTAIMLNAVLVNDSSKAVLVIARFELKLLWKDTEFDWLFDPAEISPAKVHYEYSSVLKYPRDKVLNHRRYELGKLAPGDSLKGLLMGKGTATIPAEFRQGQTVTMKLVVHDTRGKKYSGLFELCIDRQRG